MSEFRSFISEADLEAVRKKRQEEWEKVRKPEDPLDRPQEEYDNRSLYDKLKEQKDKQQAEYEEAHKLKNMIRGLDDEEVEFLDLVDRTKEKMETQRLKEDLYEIKNFQKAVATLAEKSAEQKLDFKRTITTPFAPTKGVKKSPQSLLASVVKRKSTSNSDNTSGKKSKLETSENNEKCDNADETTEANNEINEDRSSAVPTVKCIGILPGLGIYSDSSDSDNSSSDCALDHHSAKYDLLGRPKFQNADD